MALRPEIRTPQTGEIRRGRGFTPKELQDAGISIADARWMAIPLDHRRRTHHPENVTILKEYLKRIKKLGKAASAAKPKTLPKDRKTVKPVPTALETDLTEISGVTKKLAETLVAIGVPSIRVLSTTSSRRIARLADLKRERAEKLVESAKRYILNKARAAREERAKEPGITELKHLPDITRGEVAKLRDLGVETLEDLKVENARDLSLLTGILESRIKAWIKLIKQLGGS